MPLPNGMKKLQELPVGMDWELVRAGATPGPGQYYRDDTADSIPGGTLAQGKAKSAVDWECYRAAQIPAPGDYYNDDTSASIPGGTLAKGNSKSGVDWECYRASQLPGPDYDLDKSYNYLDGKNGRAGFTMKGRAGPAALPYPYEQFAQPNSSEIRTEPHPSHEQSLTPWREDDWKQRKHEAALALNRRRGGGGASSDGDSSVGADGPLRDDYANSLTPWRERPARAGKQARPASAPPGPQGEAETTAATAKVDVTREMPWRDAEGWTRCNADVHRMRKEMGERARALKEKMESRPPFGGNDPGAKLKKPAPWEKPRPKPKPAARPQSAPARRTGTAPGKGGKGGKGGRGKGPPALRASFAPSSSTPDVLRVSDASSIGGGVGASFGSTGSWRTDLARRAERLSQFSLSDGAVETSLVVVGGGGAKRRTRRSRRMNVSGYR